MNIIVIATKYSTNFRANHPEEIGINFQGNGTKSMHTSVKRSLEKLQTDYIDLVCSLPVRLCDNNNADIIY